LDLEEAESVARVTSLRDLTFILLDPNNMRRVWTCLLGSCSLRHVTMLDSWPSTAWAFPPPSTECAIESLTITCLQPTRSPTDVTSFVACFPRLRSLHVTLLYHARKPTALRQELALRHELREAGPPGLTVAVTVGKAER
jgi:hypothetical protein